MANANELDFFGEGTAAKPAAAPPGAATSTVDRNVWERANKATQPRDLLDKNHATANSDPTLSMAAHNAGNIGGAGGAYNAVSDAGRAAFDYYRDIRNPSSVKDFLNSKGEDVGVTRAGDAMLGTVGDTFQVGTPFNMLDRVVDPTTGLGTTADGVGGRAVTGATPGTAAAAKLLQGATPDSPGDLLTAGAGGIGKTLNDALGGGSEQTFDASGADRGGMGSYAGDFDRVRGFGDAARGLGADVLSGATLPGGAGAGKQESVMKKALAFKPTAQQGVANELGAFTAQPEGAASKAQLLLDEVTQKGMGDALSVARSGRARDAGSVARALNVAQAENAFTGADAARSGALLRAQEAQDFRNQQLQALGQKGQLAQGVDQTKLGALNLGGDIANQIRSGNVAERGQTLNYSQGQQQIGAGLESDVLKTIPQLEQIRHEDQFDLTPQQKLLQAKLGQGPDKTTADYVTALLGDVLGAI